MEGLDLDMSLVDATGRGKSLDEVVRDAVEYRLVLH